MFDYLKMLYRSMKYAGYQPADAPKNHSQMRDELAIMMGLKF